MDLIVHEIEKWLDSPVEGTNNSYDTDHGHARLEHEVKEFAIPRGKGHIYNPVFGGAIFVYREPHSDQLGVHISSHAVSAKNLSCKDKEPAQTTGPSDCVLTSTSRREEISVLD